MKEKGEAILLFLVFFIFYAFFQTKSIYGGDSGDLVTAAWVWGIPHPPGYPLYTLIASIIVHAIPWFTPAWRVGLISSLSSAATLAIFYLLIKKMTRSWFALLGTLTLAFVYPFWLYSEVAEVFALNNLFTVGLIYLFFEFYGIADFSLRSKRALKCAIPFFFILGLSLTHHHTIVLLLPGFLYLIWENKFYKHYKIYKFYILFFLLGLSFYLYPLIACQKTPLICWDDPVNLKNLIRLVSRADYGTFISTSNLGNAPLLRIFSVLAGFKLVLVDFHYIGIILMILGVIYLYQKNKNIFSFVMITLLSALFFIFYSSFMLVNDFMTATFERFLLFPYIFLSLLIGCGFFWIYLQSQNLLKKIKLSKLSKTMLLTGFKLIFFIFPLSLLLANFNKISVLKNDLTAEAMAKDFLSPLPRESILIASSDTTIFDLQYSRYVLGLRPDVKVISKPLLTSYYYKKSLAKKFPELFISQETDNQKNFEEFVIKNASQSAVFIDNYSFNQGEDWIPYGLSWQYIAKTNQPLLETTIKENLKYWQKFNDPLLSLKDKDNLFLNDILRVYEQASLEFGHYLLDNNFLTEAEKFFKQADNLKENNIEAVIGLGAVFLKKKDCEKAKTYFEKVLTWDKENSYALGYLRKNELECFKNESEAKKYEDQCVSVTEKKETSLESLGK